MKSKTRYALYGVAAFSALSSATQISAAEQQRPNILFIAVDDLKPLLGCYGDKIAQTPVMDEIARQGVIFEQAYCQQAVSGPSRASLLTGMRPDRTRVWDLKTFIRDINPDIITLPQAFRENGYNTMGIGKIYDTRSVDKMNDEPSWSTFVKSDKYYNKKYGKPLMGQYHSEEVQAKYDVLAKPYLDKGMSGWPVALKVQKHIKPSVECIDIEDDAYSDGSIVNGTSTMLPLIKENEPFFLAIGFKRPHLPFCAPKKYWDLYDRDAIELEPYQQVSEDPVALAYHDCGEMRGYTDIPPLSSFDDTHNLAIDKDKQRELLHGYYASVSYMDAQLGKIMKEIKSKGLDKNTIIVLWGDHGWHLGDHGLWCKHSNFEQATRVPFIILDPNSKGGKRITMPVELMDIYPTLCDYANITTPSTVEGTSLRSFVERGSASKSNKPYAVSQYPRTKAMGYSIRTKLHRYTVWVEWDGKTAASDNKVLGVELYDYKVDPLETKNLVNNAKYKAVVKEMNGYWEEFKEDNASH